MHKDWVRINGEREAEFWRDNFSRPDKYRYIEETDRTGAGDQAFVEFWEDVPDDKDEPLVDGIYVDKDDERWLRINGWWSAPDCGLYDLVKWEDEWAEYAPFELVDPSAY